MTDRKAAFISMGVPWLITLVVAVVVMVNRRRDMIDDLVVLGLAILSARQTFLHWKKGQEQKVEK